MTHAKFIDVRHEMRKRHLSEADWEAGFFSYRAGGEAREGLFFISKSFAPIIEQRITSNFSINSLPDPQHFIISWQDAGKAEAIGHTRNIPG